MEKLMTKEFTRSALVFMVLLMIPVLVFAQDTSELKDTTEGVLRILNIVITIVFVIAVIIFGWGIVKLIMAAGDSAEIKQAKQFIWWGVIGIAILASIFGLITYLREFFGVDSGGANTIIPPRVTPIP
jgi:succinate dehydrogenase/fumarate reductase cytochrome b subunit